MRVTTIYEPKLVELWNERSKRLQLSERQRELRVPHGSTRRALGGGGRALERQPRAAVQAATRAGRTPRRPSGAGLRPAARN